MLGPDDAVCLEAWVELGGALSEAGRTEEALAVLHAVVADEDPGTMGPLGARATRPHHLYLADREEEALQVYAGLHEAGRRVLGDRHKHTVETRKTIRDLPRSCAETTARFATAPRARRSRAAARAAPRTGPAGQAASHGIGSAGARQPHARHQY